MNPVTVTSPGVLMNAPRFSADRPSTDADIVGIESGVRVNGPTMEPADETMTDVLAEYAEAGFVGDAFASTGGQISCGTCSWCLSPAHVAIEGMRRLEGASDPSDMAAVLAIVCPVCQTKATLVLKFGPEASVDEIAIWQHVRKVQTGRHHGIESRRRGREFLSMSRWGEQTVLALKNFRVSGEPFPLAVIHELAIIKAEAARANAASGTLDLDERDVAGIIKAADAVARGEYDDQFLVDVFQTGSGTSSNMNVNEVVSSLAMDIADTGNAIHPNDHVNAAQSSNDTVPSAVHMAVARALRDALFPAMHLLSTELHSSATQFRRVVKIGRTHLMDAVPVTLGQEFGGMARMVDLARGSMDVAFTRLMELPLGGTATGTGLNAPAGYVDAMIHALRTRTGFPWEEAVNHFEAQSGRDALVSVSAACRGLGISLFKIANDLRWMASGPIGGLGEITLPALQAGSSIMPGKVNPVIPEVVCQVVAQVIGNDAAVAFAATSGSFELNVMMPVMARNVLASVNLLAGATDALAAQCIRGLVAHEDAMRSRVERSPMVATALNEAIGYERAKKLVDDSVRLGVPVAELAVRDGLLDEAQAQRLTDVMRLAYPHAQQ